MRQGAPPSRVRLHRERMVRLFCNGTFKEEKLMLLNHLPNGDWDKFEVEIYVPDPLNVCPDSIAVGSAIEFGLAHTFTHL